MQAHYTKALLSLAVVASLAVPGVAQARHGSDDPPNHVRHEHHRFGHDRRGSDDGVRHHRGSDDGPNHR
jgi:hypothetical protein